MAEAPLKNQIIGWLRNQSYWLQYSGNELLEGALISDALLNKTCNYFKEDLELTELAEGREPSL